jgi:cob(I)alamin adenosyltransferase
MMKSIATKTGDTGTTGLLYGERVLKSDPRIDLVGQIDELSAYLGLTKIETNRFLSTKSIYLTIESAPIAYDCRDFIEVIQKTLIQLMGEFVVEPDKLERYIKSFPILTETHLKEVDRRIELIESEEGIIPKDWILYGHNPVSAQFDLASKICRKVERNLWSQVLCNKITCRSVITTYLNRLSDYLFLCARFFEKNWVN